VKYIYLSGNQAFPLKIEKRGKSLIKGASRAERKSGIASSLGSATVGKKKSCRKDMERALGDSWGGCSNTGGTEEMGGVRGRIEGDC